MLKKKIKKIIEGIPSKTTELIIIVIEVFFFYKALSSLGVHPSKQDNNYPKQCSIKINMAVFMIVRWQGTNYGALKWIQPFDHFQTAKRRFKGLRGSLLFTQSFSQ